MNKTTLSLFIFNFIASTNTYTHFKSTYVSPIKSTVSLNAGLRLLIQGTKNAYTTLQAWDVVLYSLNQPTHDGRSKALGYLTPFNTIQPLCVRDKGDAEFHSDPSQPPIPAQILINDGKLLRIISSDRRKEVFTIDEYISDDIYIPLMNTVASNTNDTITQVISPLQISVPNDVNLSTTAEFIAAASNSVHVQKTTSTDLDSEILLTEAELKVATLQLKLLQLQNVKRTHNLQFGGSSLTMPAVLQSTSDTDASIPTIDSAALSRSTVLTTAPVCTNATDNVSLTSATLLKTGEAFSKVVVAGSLLIVSGCRGVDVQSARLAAQSTYVADPNLASISRSYASLETQVREAFKTLDDVLVAHGSDRKNLVLLTITLIDAVEMTGTVQRVYASMYPQIAYNPPVDEDRIKARYPLLPVEYAPAIRFVQSIAPMPYDCDIEIDAFAYIP